MEIDRQTEMVLYLRNNKNAPVGVLFAKKEELLFGGGPQVVSIGWSKANTQFNRFDKSRGWDIAKVRCERASKSTAHQTLGVSVIPSHSPVIGNLNIPYVFTNSIESYLDKIKASFNLDVPVVFVVPSFSDEVLVDDAVLLGKPLTSRRRTSYFKISR